MKPTTVIFSHGKESGPFGRKIERLIEVAKSFGLQTVSVDYRSCANAAERVALLRSTIAATNTHTQAIVLVGSSMGGYVSAVTASATPIAGLFLMAPALWMPAEEYTVQHYEPMAGKIEITHGYDDDIVPWRNSLRFAETHTHSTTLHLVADDHRLSHSHEFLATQFHRFLQELIKSEAQ